MTTCKLITRTGKVCTDESKAKKNKLNKNNYKQTEQQRTTYESPPKNKNKQNQLEKSKMTSD